MQKPYNLTTNMPKAVLHISAQPFSLSVGGQASTLIYILYFYFLLLIPQIRTITGLTTRTRTGDQSAGVAAGGDEVSA